MILGRDVRLQVLRVALSVMVNGKRWRLSLLHYNNITKTRFENGPRG